MTEAQFRRGFLRLASRGKAGGARRSPVYRRRFTGEKGVGRLAAHKLGAHLSVTSVAAIGGRVPLTEVLRQADPRAEPAQIIQQVMDAARSVVSAKLDWDEIEKFDTISSITSGIEFASTPGASSAALGTTLAVSRLRHAWGSLDIADVVRQLTNFEPPALLGSVLPRSISAETLLFKTPQIRDAHRSDPGMTLTLQGDFSAQEEYWAGIGKSAEWVLEIQAQKGHQVRYRMIPTRAGYAANPASRAIEVAAPHPAPDTGPFFDARIFLRTGPVPSLERKWHLTNSGVRVYLEGFRVLPYGEQGNDWLNLDLDYTRRAGRFEFDPLVTGPEEDLEALRRMTSRDVSLRLMPNRNYFGAVFLTDSGATALRTLVNREGFVPDQSFDALASTVRTGVDLLQRSWALASVEQKRARAALARASRDETRAAIDSEKNEDVRGHGEPADGSGQKQDGDKAESDTSDEAAGLSDDPDELWLRASGSGAASAGSATELKAAVDAVRTSFERLRGLPESIGETRELGQQIEALQEAADRLIEDASMLRRLASVGSQLAAFTHEIGHLVPVAIGAERALAPIDGQRWPSPAVEARRAVAELRRSLERQASYLVDAASASGRRRRVRQNLAEQVAIAFLGFSGAAAERSVELKNEVPPDHRTPPMFRADLQAILANLLSNGIKAASGGGTVVVRSAEFDGGTRMTVENTGVAVEPAQAEDWFKPYASTTVEVDLTLGQGVGLGLPITRDLVTDYGGTVRFVRPSTAMSTAIEVVLPE